MNEARQVRQFVRIVVWLNLVTLALVFVGPRYAFMVNHWGMGPDAVLQTPGTWDLPNVYRPSYRLAEAIRLETPKNARIFLPKGEGAMLDPAALLRVLRPRTLFFEGDPGFKNKLRQAPTVSRSWKVVPTEKVASCRKQSARPLGDSGYSICRLDR